MKTKTLALLLSLSLHVAHPWPTFAACNKSALMDVSHPHLPLCPLITFPCWCLMISSTVNNAPPPPPTVSVLQVNFVVSQLFALLTAVWFRLYLHPSKTSPFIRHVVATLLGFYLALFCFGWWVMNTHFYLEGEGIACQDVFIRVRFIMLYYVLSCMVCSCFFQYYLICSLCIAKVSIIQEPPPPCVLNAFSLVLVTLSHFSHFSPKWLIVGGGGFH